MGKRCRKTSKALPVFAAAMRPAVRRTDHVSTFAFHGHGVSQARWLVSWKIPVGWCKGVPFIYGNLHMGREWSHPKTNKKRALSTKHMDFHQPKKGFNNQHWGFKDKKSWFWHWKLGFMNAHETLITPTNGSLTAKEMWLTNQTWGLNQPVWV